MTRDEIVRAAGLGQPMPQDLDLPEALLFQAMAFLYGRHREGQVDTERAKEDKEKILEIYENLKNRKE